MDGYSKYVETILPKKAELVEQLKRLIEQSPDSPKKRDWLAGLSNLSDDDFIKLYTSVINNIDSEQMNKIAKTPLAGGLTDYQIEFLSKRQNEYLLEKMRCSKPSDLIHLDSKADQRLIDLWRESAKSFLEATGKGFIPADLFFSGTVPLMDFEFSVELDNLKVLDRYTTRSRCVIYPDYKERIARAVKEEQVLVGAMEIHYPLPGIDKRIGITIITLIVELMVIKGVDSLLCNSVIGYRNMNQEQREHFSANCSYGNFIQNFFSHMETWYGIQIALLHPIIKTVFRKTKPVPVHPPKVNSKKGKRRKVRYIQEVVIRVDDIDDEVEKMQRSYNRKTLVWYVIGHWRHKGKPNQVFIQPCWKGPLRHLKMNNVGEERERVIAQAEGEEE